MAAQPRNLLKCIFDSYEGQILITGDRGVSILQLNFSANFKSGKLYELEIGMLPNRNYGGEPPANIPHARKYPSIEYVGATTSFGRSRYRYYSAPPERPSISLATGRKGIIGRFETRTNGMRRRVDAVYLSLFYFKPLSLGWDMARFLRWVSRISFPQSWFSAALRLGRSVRDHTTIVCVGGVKFGRYRYYVANPRIEVISSSRPE